VLDSTIEPRVPITDDLRHPIRIRCRRSSWPRYHLATSSP